MAKNRRHSNKNTTAKPTIPNSIKVEKGVSFDKAVDKAIAYKAMDPNIQDALLRRKDDRGNLVSKTAIYRNKDQEIFNTILDVTNLQKMEDGTRIPYVSTLYGNFLINPSSVSISTFQKMVSTDDVIRRSYELNIATIIDGIGEYYHDNSKYQKFVRYAFKQLPNGRDELFRQLLSCMWAGASTNLIMPEKDNNGYTIAKDVMRLPPLSIQFTATPQGYVDKVFQYVYNYPYAGTQNALSTMGGIGGFSYDAAVSGLPAGVGAFGIDAQASLGDMDYPWRTNFINTFGLVELDKSRVIHMIYDRYNGKINPYGESIMRPIYSNWLMKTFVKRIYTSGMERCANPMLVGYAEGTQSVQIGQMSINAVEALYNAMQAYTEESAIILPGLQGQLFDVQVVDYTGDFTVYEKALAYLDKSLENGLFVPEGIFSADTSYAGATAQNSIYSRTMNSISNELEHVILTQFVKWLLHENFGDDIDDFGRFDTKLQNLDDQLKQGKLISELVAAGFINPGIKTQNDIVLKTFGYPELTDEEFKKLEKLNKEMPPRSKNNNSGKVNTKESNDHYKNRSSAEIN